MESSGANTNSGSAYDFDSKVIILGDHGVGKSSILVKYTNNTFDYGIPSSNGVDFKLKILKVLEQKIRLVIWDTAGQEKYRGITSTYYKGCSAIVIVFDMNDEESFTKVERWFDEIKIYADKSLPKILVANKCDMQEKVRRESVEDFARRMEIQVIFTSAKDGQGVNEIFEEMAKRIVSARLQTMYDNKVATKKKDEETPLKTSMTISKNSKPKRQRWVCPLF